MKHLLLTTIAAVVLAETAFADPIHQAAGNGDIAGVQAELDKGVDVNAKDSWGSTPLHEAAEKGHKEIAELLIAAGADVDMKDKHGRTSLLMAAWWDHKETAEVLIGEGADVNAMADNGVTPLDLSIKLNVTEITTLLRKHGGKTGEELKAEGK
ncbi:MAG: ankyrin repeat domain-containing protein [Nitrospinaceae bacterium]|jgi:ankyrin repeat protein|nr:ankyrin repeat domain-containing protein [Nitrospinaceae bacterium]